MHRTIVFIKLVKKGAHSVVPQLDDSIMKGGQDPGSVDVEGQTLHPRGLGLKLGQHASCVWLFTLSIINIFVSERKRKP